MSHLALYSQFNLQMPYKVSNDFDAQAEQLADDGIIFSKWPVQPTLRKSTIENAQLLRLYDAMVEDIKREYNFLYADVASFKGADAYAISLRGQYLSEHTHCEHEARFFIEGSVLVYIHVNQNIHILECGAGDFILIPKAVKHWMDIGPSPSFTSIRWYSTREGLQNQFTGSYVAESTPRWETIYGEAHFEIDNK